MRIKIKPSYKAKAFAAFSMGYVIVAAIYFKIVNEANDEDN